MTRAYIRLDPGFADRKVDYPDGPHAALIDCFCFAETQMTRGRFRDIRILRALLGRRGRWVQYLVDHGDLSILPDGRVYVDGWDEWQEGDWKVNERVQLIRGRHGDAEPERSRGAERVANHRLRTRIFERDGYTCRYCGNGEYPRDWLVVDHVDPVGATDDANLVTACRPCNKRKGGRTPEGAGMPLRPIGNALQTDAGNALPPSDIAVGGAVGADKAVGADNATPDDDHLDAFYRLTDSWPSPKVIPWLNSLADDHGPEAVSRTLAVEWQADSDRSTLLSRTRDRLEREAHAAEKARREAERRRAKEERARIEDMPQEQREANLARLRSELERTGLLPKGGA